MRRGDGYADLSYLLAAVEEQAPYIMTIMTQRLPLRRIERL